METRELAALLSERGVPWKKWSKKKGGKTVKDLAQAMALGEKKLVFLPIPPFCEGGTMPVLESTVASLRIYDSEPDQAHRRTLFEYKYKEATGLWEARTKNQGSVSGSIRTGESLEEALLRELYEECGIRPSKEDFRETFRPVTGPPPGEIEPSRNFEGLYEHKVIRAGTWTMQRTYMKPYYLERAGKRKSSQVKGISRWWPIIYWDLGVPPPPAKSIPELLAA